MVAKTLARVETIGQDLNEITQTNVDKVTRYRPGGAEELREMVESMKERDDELFTRRRDDGVVEEKYQWGNLYERHGKRKL